MSRLLVVTFASGFAALTYEVVWLSVLSTVVGATTVAASATLAVFFLGLGIGAVAGARLAERTRTPLRICAAVEFGIAACAGVFLLLLGPVGALHRSLFADVGHLATILVALLLLLPPSTLMGATLPLVGEVMVRKADELGRKGSLIYASNTLGGALGASLSAFWLIAELGVAGTCAIAALLNAAAAVALTTMRVDGAAKREPRPPSTISRAALLLALVSGFFMLSLEVLWTRMLVQVVHNSVYTYGAILLVFLLSLGLGSWLTAYAIRFARVRQAARQVAAIVALITMVMVLWSAHGFGWLTDGFKRIRGEGSLALYVGKVILVSAATFLPAAVAGGMLFPLSLQLAGPGVKSGGRGLGVLGSSNTLAAIAGSLVGGFVLIRTPFGLFDSLAWIAAGYALAAVLLVQGTSRRVHLLRLAMLGIAALAVVLTLRLAPPIALKGRERIIDLRQGIGGIVAVTKRPGRRTIKVNNHYSLGSTRGGRYQLRQGIVPVLLHPKPERVFFIGLGTGMTASAALLFDDVESLTVVELTAEVVELSQAHFSDEVGGLYTDARAQVKAADARHHLATHEQRYDLVVGDLFIPWRAGVGNLYSREHFEVVRSRLRPGGIFAQWIPLYQMSRFELAVIAKTMVAVFGDIEVWRCEFQANRSILALVARAPSGPPFESSQLASRVDAFASGHRASIPGWMQGYGMFELYVGSINERHPLVANVPLNTDRNPVIAYQAPRTHGASLGGESPWLGGEGYLRLLNELRAEAPSALDEEAKRHARAGFHYHERKIRKALAQRDAAARAERAYRQLRGDLDSSGR